MSTASRISSLHAIVVITAACALNPVLARGACEEGQPASGAIVDVRGTGHTLLRSPDPNASPIVNEKATRLLGSTTYHSIDSTTKVRVLCEAGDWVKVQLTEPKWLRHVVGWTQRENLALPRRPGEARVFTVDDIYWDEVTREHKDLLVTAVNRISQEDPRCKNCLDPSSVSLSRTKSSPGAPVFYVNCGSGLSTVNVFFTPEDVTSPEPFSAPRHIDGSLAIDLTEAYAKKSAIHASTVEFSRVAHLAVIEHPNGRTTVMSKFTAKNAMNLELTYGIRCLLDESGIIEGHITESD